MRKRRQAATRSIDAAVKTLPVTPMLRTDTKNITPLVINITEPLDLDEMPMPDQHTL